MAEYGEEEGFMLPVDDGLFADTFSDDSVYKFIGQELKISQVFSANLGVAAPVWDAVSSLLTPLVHTGYIYSAHDEYRCIGYVVVHLIQ